MTAKVKQRKKLNTRTPSITVEELEGMKREHEIKCHPNYFFRLCTGEKTFEIRKIETINA